MQHLDIILPILLLGIAFLLKLVVDRNIDVPTAIHAICELPVDILFLSLSFSIAYTIADPVNNSQGLFYCFVGLAISILVVFIWRRTLQYFIEKRKWLWLFLLFANLIVASISLKYSVVLIMANQREKEKATKKQQKQPNNQPISDSTKNK
jgi:hypothetical protein